MNSDAKEESNSGDRVSGELTPGSLSEPLSKPVANGQKRGRRLEGTP